MNRAWILLAALVTAGCSATVSREGIANVPGEEVWKTELDLELGERALVDGGQLELTLVATGVERATVLVQSGGGRRQEELRTGPGGRLQHPPYEIRLLSTGIDGSARIQVRRQWGQQR
ncbi:MAG TPA: hypothetical protein VJP59_08970 [Gemmatimonadota bacterium]|nr:hypothetical protein [Gemmatimonadota bacterium]